MDAKRDWGFAKEYVEGMWRILQADEPDTYVLATNRTETVRDFVEMAFKTVGVSLEFQGSEDNEVAMISAIDREQLQSVAPEGVDASLREGKVVVKVNPKFYRPAEVDLLIGNPQKAKEKLGWVPQTTLEELCAMMVKADLTRNQIGFSF